MRPLFTQSPRRAPGVLRRTCRETWTASYGGRAHDSAAQRNLLPHHSHQHSLPAFASFDRRRRPSTWRSPATSMAPACSTPASRAQRQHRNPGRCIMWHDKVVPDCAGGARCEHVPHPSLVHPRQTRCTRAALARVIGHRSRSLCHHNLRPPARLKVHAHFAARALGPTLLLAALTR